MYNIAMETKTNKFLNILFFLSVIFIIISGIYLRFNIYLDGYSLWMDELMLSESVIYNPIFSSLYSLEAGQKAPPLFVFFTYINSIIANSCNVYVLRFIPFISSIGTLIAFYFLSKRIFKSRIAVIVSLFLVSINTALIFYANEFKPYSSDVFICILLLLSYEYIDLKNFTIKKTLLYSVLIFFTVLSSFPSVYIIPALLISKIIEQKRFPLKLIFPFFSLAAGSLYLIWMFRNIRTIELNLEYWQSGFFNFTFSSLFNIINEFFNFLELNLSWSIICLISGILIFISQKNKYRLLIILIIFFVLLGSYFKILPLKERIMLYMTPIFILLMSKPAEMLKTIKEQKVHAFIISVFISGMLLFSVKNYNLTNLNSIVRMQPYQDRIQVKKDVETILNNYNNELIITDCSDFQGSVKYYNLVQKKLLNLKMMEYYDDFENKLNTLKQFKDIHLIIRATSENYPYFYNKIKKISAENNLEYNDNFIDNNKNVHLVHIYKKP